LIKKNLSDRSYSIDSKNIADEKIVDRLYIPVPDTIEE
jgi:hypothetical protein